MQGRLTLTSTALLALLSGCPADPGPCDRTNSCPVGAACSEHFDCESTHCAGGVCAEGCSSSADCAAAEACVASFDGPIRCSTTCDPFDGFLDAPPDTFCGDGLVTTCATHATPGDYCDVCGCPAGQRCAAFERITCAEAGGGCRCVTPLPFGSPCTSHEECESENCSGSSDSTMPRTCQAAAGAACTSAGGECVYCNLPREGTTRCRQSCDASTAAGCSGGEVCLGSRTTREFGCYTRCESSSDCFIREHCDFAADGFTQYCAPD